MAASLTSGSRRPSVTGDTVNAPSTRVHTRSLGPAPPAAPAPKKSKPQAPKELKLDEETTRLIDIFRVGDKILTGAAKPFERALWISTKIKETKEGLNLVRKLKETGVGVLAYVLVGSGSGTSARKTFHVVSYDDALAGIAIKTARDALVKELTGGRKSLMLGAVNSKPVDAKISGTDLKGIHFVSLSGTLGNDALDMALLRLHLKFTVDELATKRARVRRGAVGRSTSESMLIEKENRQYDNEEHALEILVGKIKADIDRLSAKIKASGTAVEAETEDLAVDVESQRRGLRALGRARSEAAKGGAAAAAAAAAAGHESKESKEERKVPDTGFRKMTAEQLDADVKKRRADLSKEQRKRQSRAIATKNTQALAKAVTGSHAEEVQKRAIAALEELIDRDDEDDAKVLDDAMNALDKALERGQDIADSVRLLERATVQAEGNLYGYDIWPQGRVDGKYRLALMELAVATKTWNPDPSKTKRAQVAVLGEIDRLLARPEIANDRGFRDMYTKLKKDVTDGKLYVAATFEEAMGEIRRLWAKLYPEKSGETTPQRRTGAMSSGTLGSPSPAKPRTSGPYLKEPGDVEDREVARNQKDKKKETNDLLDKLLNEPGYAGDFKLFDALASEVSRLADLVSTEKLSYGASRYARYVIFQLWRILRDIRRNSNSGDEKKEATARALVRQIGPTLQEANSRFKQNFPDLFDRSGNALALTDEADSQEDPPHGAQDSGFALFGSGIAPSAPVPVPLPSGSGAGPSPAHVVVVSYPPLANDSERKAVARFAGSVITAKSDKSEILSVISDLCGDKKSLRGYRKWTIDPLLKRTQVRERTLRLLRPWMKNGMADHPQTTGILSTCDLVPEAFANHPDSDYCGAGPGSIPEIKSLEISKAEREFARLKDSYGIDVDTACWVALWNYAPYNTQAAEATLLLRRDEAYGKRFIPSALHILSVILPTATFVYAIAAILQKVEGKRAGKYEPDDAMEKIRGSAVAAKVDELFFVSDFVELVCELVPRLRSIAAKMFCLASEHKAAYKLAMNAMKRNKVPLSTITLLHGTFDSKRDRILAAVDLYRHMDELGVNQECVNVVHDAMGTRQLSSDAFIDSLRKELELEDESSSAHTACERFVYSLASACEALGGYQGSSRLASANFPTGAAAGAGSTNGEEASSPATPPSLLHAPTMVLPQP